MSSEVEETLNRINSHKGVKGVLIMNAEGIPIRSNLSDEDTENYSALVSQLAIKAHHVVRTLDEGDELAFLRVRSKKHEIMIAPDKEYILVVIQNPEAGSH
jgi:dynein light chain roadblock-type